MTKPEKDQDAPKPATVRDAAGRFVKGHSGNPAGKKLGARHHLTEAFLGAMKDDFCAHGVRVIETVRTEKPAEYLRVIASLVPKDFNVTLNPLEELDDGQLIDRLRQLNDTIGPFLADRGDPDQSGA